MEADLQYVWTLHLYWKIGMDHLYAASVTVEPLPMHAWVIDPDIVTMGLPTEATLTVYNCQRQVVHEATGTHLADVAVPDEKKEKWDACLLRSNNLGIQAND